MAARVGWSQNAHNSSSGAHGIPQAPPGSKMSMFGGDWATNPETQIWGLHYIKSGYGTRRRRSGIRIRTTGTDQQRIP